MTAALDVTPERLRDMPLPHPGDEADKDGRGRVLVIGGSVEVPGAVLLAGTAALRAGAGKLQMATCRSVAPHLGLAVPEALVAGLPETPEGGIDPDCAEALCRRAARCDAVLFGPGMTGREEVATLTARIIAGLEAGDGPGPTLVLDAEALIALDRVCDALCRRQGRTIITPHAGEMAGLLGASRAEIERDPAAAAGAVADRFGIVVVLKGACTCIVEPGGRQWTYGGGNVGLATSGSGDTLAGVVAGLAARGADPVRAAVWGVYLHGEAGNRLARRQGTLGFLARELLAEIPPILHDLAPADG